AAGKGIRRRATRSRLRVWQRTTRSNSSCRGGTLEQRSLTVAAQNISRSRKGTEGLGLARFHQLIESSQHFRAVRSRIYLGVNLADHALGIDQEGIARGHDVFAELLCRAVLRDDFLIVVGEKLECQVLVC